MAPIDSVISTVYATAPIAVGTRPIELVLSAAAAVFWPARNALLIADLHLGKGDVFRRAGIGVPGGTTAQDLQRLDQLLREFACSELIVLGDMVHGPLPDAPWRQQWLQFRAARPQVEINVVVGNHDLALTAISAAALGLELRPEPWCLDGLALCHHPQSVRGHVCLAGHLHPGVRLPGISKRLPAFARNNDQLLLPAFCSLAGTAPVLRRDYELHVITPPSAGIAPSDPVRRELIAMRRK
jgi:uncharacterized protein